MLPNNVTFHVSAGLEDVASVKAATRLSHAGPRVFLGGGGWADWFFKMFLVDLWSTPSLFFHFWSPPPPPDLKKIFTVVFGWLHLICNILQPENDGQKVSPTV